MARIVEIRETPEFREERFAMNYFLPEFRAKIIADQLNSFSGRETLTWKVVEDNYKLSNMLKPDILTIEDFYDNEF